MSNFLRTERIREAVTKTAKLLVRGKIEVTQQGAQPYVRYNHDGSIACVNLPMIPEAPSAEFLDAVQGFIDHEVAHVLFTDKLAEIEVLERAAKEQRLPLERIASLSNAFEDVRIERLMKLEYEGAAYNLTRSLEFVMGGAIKQALDACDHIPDEERSQARAINGLLVWIRAQGGDHNAQLFIDENNLSPDFAVFSDLFPDMAQRLAAMESSADAAQLGIDFYVAITPPSPPAEEPEGEEEEDHDNPSLGKAKDGTAEDTPEDDDAEGSDQSDDGDESAEDGNPGDSDSEGEGAEDESSDDDGDAGSGDQGDEETDEDEGEGQNGEADVPESDGQEGDGSDEGGEGDNSEGEGEDRDKGESDEVGGSDGEKSDGKDETEEESGGGKKTKSRRVTEAMKRLNPYYRSLIAGTMRKKQTVSDLARVHSKPLETIKNDLRDARRKFRHALKEV